MAKKIEYKYIFQTGFSGIEQKVFNTEQELQDFLLEQLADMGYHDFQTYLRRSSTFKAKALDIEFGAEYSLELTKGKWDN